MMITILVRQATDHLVTSSHATTLGSTSMSRHSTLMESRRH